jgi:hypothetical protein
MTLGCLFELLHNRPPRRFTRANMLPIPNKLYQYAAAKLAVVGSYLSSTAVTLLYISVVTWPGVILQ